MFTVLRHKLKICVLIWIHFVLFPLTLEYNKLLYGFLITPDLLFQNLVLDNKIVGKHTPRYLDNTESSILAGKPDNSLLRGQPPLSSSPATQIKQSLPKSFSPLYSLVVLTSLLAPYGHLYPGSGRPDRDHRSDMANQDARREGQAVGREDWKPDRAALGA